MILMMANISNMRANSPILVIQMDVIQGATALVQTNVTYADQHHDDILAQFVDSMLEGDQSIQKPPIEDLMKEVEEASKSVSRT